VVRSAAVNNDDALSNQYEGENVDSRVTSGVKLTVLPGKNEPKIEDELPVETSTTEENK
jgi:hypothetical protein